jgi:hypothetical protein
VISGEGWIKMGLYNFNREKLNIPGLIGGLMVIYLVLFMEPWWVLRAVGEDPSFYAYISPFKIDIGIMGRTVDIPLLKYVVISGLLTYLWIGITSVIASLFPSRNFSRPLLGFRALIITLSIFITLYIGLRVARNYVDVTLPLIGTETLVMTIPYQDANIVITTPVEAYLTQAYYLMLVASILIAIGKIIIWRK